MQISHQISDAELAREPIETRQTKSRTALYASPGHFFVALIHDVRWNHLRVCLKQGFTLTDECLGVLCRVHTATVYPIAHAVCDTKGGDRGTAIVSAISVSVVVGDEECIFSSGIGVIFELLWVGVDFTAQFQRPGQAIVLFESRGFGRVVPISSLFCDDAQATISTFQRCCCCRSIRCEKTNRFCGEGVCCIC